MAEDFSSFGTPLESEAKPDFSDAGKPLDFADAGRPLDMGQAQQETGDSTMEQIGQNVAEFGKGIPQGVGTTFGGALKGFGALLETASPELRPFLEEMVQADKLDPDQVSDLRRRADKGLGTKDRFIFHSALSDVLEGTETGASLRDQLAKPVKDTWGFKAGKAVEEASNIFPAAPGYENSIGRELGTGVGSVVAGIGTSLIPGVGPAAAAGMFTLAGAGEAVDRAIKDGATESQIVEAARLGQIAGLTDSVPVETLLGRIPVPGAGLVQIPATMLGTALRAVGRIGWQATVEGIQEGGQQFLQNLIAREVYKPEQGLGEDVLPSAATGGGVGAIVEMGRMAMTSFGGRRAKGIREQAAEQPAPVTPDDQASPIPTDLIAEGKRVVQDAAATQTADDILTAAGVPSVGNRVTINYPDGRSATGEVIDAFDERNADLGVSGQGVKIRLDNGTTFEEFFDTLRQSGASIAPEAQTQAVAPSNTTLPTAETAASVQPTMPEQDAPAAAPLPIPEQPAAGVPAAPVQTEAPAPAAPVDPLASVPDTVEDGKVIAGSKPMSGPVESDEEYAAKMWEGASKEERKAWAKSAGVIAVNLERAAAMNWQQMKPYEKNRMALHAPGFMERDRGTFKGVPVNKRARDLTDEDLAKISERDPASYEERNIEISRYVEDPRFLVPYIDEDGNRIGAFGLPSWRVDLTAIRNYLRDGTLSERGQLIDDMAKRHAELMGEGRTPDQSTRTVGMVLKAAETGRFNDAMHPDNKNARKVFEEITGVKLPKGVNDTKALFDGKPFLTENGQQLRAEPEPQRKLKEKIEAKREEKTPRKIIGKNRDGVALEEDERGVRSYVLDGVRITEPVGVKPGSAEISTDRTNRPEFQTTDERDSDSPTWAQIMSALPRDNEGRADTDVAAKLMFDISGKKQPSFMDLNPEQRFELLNRVKAYKALSPKNSTEQAVRDSREAAEGRLPIEDASKTKKIPGEYAITATGDVKDAEEARIKGGKFYAVAQRKSPFSSEKGYGNTVDEAVADALRRIGVEPEVSTTEDGNNSPKEKKPPSVAPKPIEQAALPAPKPAAYGSTNKLVTADRAEELRVRLRNKLKNQLSSGVDPEIMSIGTELAVYHLEAGTRSFADFAKRIADDLGTTVSKIKPYIRSWYNGAWYMMKDAGIDVAGYDTPDQANAAFDKIGQEVDGGKNASRTEPVDKSGDTALGGIPADEIRKTEGDGEAGSRGARGGSSDQSTDGGNAGPGGDVGRGVGGNAPNISVSTGGSDRGRGTTGQPGTSGQSDRSGYRSDGRVADYVITEKDRLGEGGAAEKFRDNIAAIRLLKKLQDENRRATPEEQATLVRYVGWGGLKSAFPKRDGSFNKGWESKGKELRDLLTDEEYNGAMRSVLDAHYTSPEIVTAIHDIVARLGFKGGKVLEPSVGTGNFFGLMPLDRRSSSELTGVELDPITGGIAKHLYPNSNVLAPVGFQEAPIADGYFDVAVGNPPFGSQGVPGAKEKDIKNFSIHNYFFARTINKLRPGGVMAMVITHRFLDKPGERERSYIGERAKFIGAIRLPNTAFQKNALTEVTTDIVIFQKLREGEKATDNDWLEVGTIPDPLGGDPIPLNQYFIQNPEMMLGRMDRSGTMRTASEPTLADDGRDLSKALTDAINSLPEGIFSPTSTSKTTAEMVAASAGPSEAAAEYDVGAFFLDGNKLMRRVATGDGALAAVEITPDTQWTEKRELGDIRFQRIKGMVRIRDAARNLLRLEASNAAESEVEKARATLNKEYDTFVVKYGYMSRQANESVFRDDPDAPLLIALELNFDPGVDKDKAKKLGIQSRKPSADKMAIFSQRVITRYEPVTKADNPKDALAVTLSERGEVDLDHIEKLTGKSPDEIVKELHDDVDEPLIFLNPETKNWETAAYYLSGNVKAKEGAAKAAGLQKNVERLRSVFPPDKKAGDIKARFGAHWIAGKYYADFAKHLFGERTGASVVYIRVTGGFAVNIGPESKTKATSVWGTDRMSGDKIIDRMLNNKDLVVFDKTDDGKKVVDQDATLRVREKSDAITAEFEEWIMRDPDRRADLTKYYNDNLNTSVPPIFDGSHLTLPGKVPDSLIKMRRHQRNAIWRGIQQRTVLLDHVVGAGKTFTIIATAMELRRMGLVKKPMIVVPNHLVEQWAADFYRLYPGAKLLTMTKNDFDSKSRKRMLGRVATGDWDAVIMAHSSFGFIPVSKHLEADFLEKQIAEIQSSIDVLRQEEGKGSRRVADLVRSQEKIRKKMMELADKPKDDLLTFEEIGVDQLFVDESHEFKNLFFATGRRGVLGMGNPKGSKKAFDLFVKTQYLLNKQDQKGVIFATGTPVSNSLTEMYTLQRYLGMPEIERLEIGSLDAFLNTFGVVSTDYELDGSGVRLKSVTRLRRMTNMNQLMPLYQQYADSVTLENIKAAYREENPGKEFPVPAVKGGARELVIIPRSSLQGAFFDEIVERASKIKPGGRDNMLAITTDARKAALDIRLVAPNTPAEEAGEKTDEATTRIKDVYNKWDDEKGTQLVFLDLSIPLSAAKNEGKKLTERLQKIEEKRQRLDFLQKTNAPDEKIEAAAMELSEMEEALAKDYSEDEITAIQSASYGFSVYDDLKAKLISAGIPSKEIAFIHDANTDEKKADLFEQVNAGIVRVLIGSTAKMGAGTNVQKRVVAEHHLDCPWRPSDIEQREGRVIRQGNELLARHGDKFEVEIFAYATEQTYDARMWQSQELKLIGIEGLRNHKGADEMEEVAAAAASAAEMKAAATGNPLILEEVKLADDIRKLESAQRNHRRSQFDLEDEKRRYEKALSELPGKLADIEADAEKAKAYDYDPFMGNPPVGTVNGVEYRSYGDAIEAASASVEKQKEGAKEGKIVKWSVEVNGKKLTSLEAVSNEISGHWGDSKPFAVTIGGTMHIRRSSASGVIGHEIAGENVVKGEIGGIPFEISLNRRETSFGLANTVEVSLGATDKIFESSTLYGKDNKDIDYGRSAISLLTKLVNYKVGKPEYVRQQIAKAERELPEINANVGKPWGKEDELASKKARQAEVRRILSGENKKDSQTDDAAQFSRRVQFAPAVVEKSGPIVESLRAELDRMGMGNIALRVQSQIKALIDGEEVIGDGYYIRQMIVVALDTADAMKVLRHEAIHALRELGVFRAAEWRTLERAALADKGRMAEIRKRYTGLPLTEEKLVEEAIADMYAEWAAGKMQAGGFLRAAFERIKAFMEAMGNAFRSNGFRTANDVFASVQSGEVGNRQQARDEKGRFTADPDAAIDEPGPMGIAERFMVAWHGTPHQVDKFSLDNVGTGEGNQAYGWGLYFAGKKQVAEWYRDTLSVRTPEGDRAWRAFNQAKNEEADAKAAYEKVVLGGKSDSEQTRLGRLVEQAQERARIADQKMKSLGRLYKVDLKPAEDEYLLWDKPLSEQPDGVRKVLAEKWWAHPSDHAKMTGEQIYRSLAEARYDQTSLTTGGFPPIKGMRDDRAASLALRDAGIPGIKYLDGTSRSAGDGSYNYVIFDDSLVSIEEKFSIRRPERPAGANDTAAFDNAESEARWNESRKGAAPDGTALVKAREALDWVKNGFARHYINLPNGRRYADVTQQLRKLEAAPQASKEKVVRILRDLTADMTAADLDLFTRKVVLDDLAWEAEQDHALPFGFTQEDVIREKAKVDAIMDRRPDLAAAVRQRKLIIRKVADDLVRSGVLHKDQVKNPAYYRHQVLEYARTVQNYAHGTGKKLRTPYWAKRMGSTLDINANLLEAEFDWLHKAFMGIETVKTIDWIKKSEHNIRRDVIASARANNERLINELLDAEGTSGPMRDQWKSFRQRIAIGLGKVRKAIEDGDLYVPEEFEAAADSLIGDAGNDANVFPFLAWIMDSGDAGAPGAAQAFKAIAERREWTKQVLGSRYADPTNIGELVKRFAPEGYVAWQPDSPDGKGRALRLYVAKSVPEHAVERVLQHVIGNMELPAEFAGVIREGFAAQVRNALTVGSAKYEMVIPEELADTLNSLRNEYEETLITFLAERPTRLWKVWTLFNPRRVIKYNINNLSGDLDAIIAGSPRLLKRVPQAARELWSVMVKKQEPSARYKEAVSRGVFDSGFTIQEIPDINTFSEFERLTKPMNWKSPVDVTKKALSHGWHFVRGATTLRENIFRYAAYLDFVDRIEAGESMDSIGYAASNPDIVDAVTDKKDRAALLARDMIGDYGAISSHGQQLRRFLLPFWSFQEINVKRYWRLNANAWGQGVVKGMGTSALTAATVGVRHTAWLYIRMAMIYAVLSVWNNLMFPDDEDDLDPEQRARLHLNLWKTEDGRLVTMRLQGSLSDIFAWFGFDDAISAIHEVNNGRASLDEVLIAIAKAPVNKLVNGMTPMIKAPLESAAGVTLFPDVFNPRPVRDGWREMFRSFALENEYDLAMDKPTRGYGQSLQNLVVNTKDPGEMAYSRAKGLAHKWLEREKGQEGISSFTSPRAQALYEWRLAKKYGDDDAADRARDKMQELGVTTQDLDASIKRAHPMGSIPIKDRGAFLRSLTEQERDVIDKATDWYQDTFVK